MNLQTYFLDREHNLLDSMFLSQQVIDRAEIGENGEVLNPLVTEFVVEVSADRFNRIRDGSLAVPRFVLSTQDEQTVKLLSSYSANLKVVGDVRIDVNLN